MKSFHCTFPLLFTFLVVSTLFSCSRKKSEPIPLYFVVAKINGEYLNYDASKDSHTASNVLPGRYDSGYFSVDIYPGEFMRLFFSVNKSLSGKPENIKITTAAYDKSRYEKYASGNYGTISQPQPSNGVCNITSIDDHTVEGTFYFDVYSDGGNGSKKLSITDGHFRLKY